MSKTAKTIIWTVIIVLVVWVIVAIGKDKSDLSGTGDIKIGVSLPLTGNAAYYGESAKRGIETAYDLLKEKYPKLSIRLSYEDNMFDAKEGINSYNKLRALGIDAVMTMTSPVAVAVEPLAMKDGILQMAVAASASSYSTPDDLSFRTTGGTQNEIIPAVKFVEAKYSETGLLYMKNEIGVSVADSFRQAINQSLKTKLVMDEGYLVENSDFRTLLLKAKSKNLRIIYIAGIESHLTSILKQAKELKYNVQILSFRTAENPLLIKNSGELAEGLIFTSAFDSEGDQTIVKTFISNFKDKFFDLPDNYSAEAYQGLIWMTDAFNECGKDYICIKNYLSGLKNVESIFGPASYDNNGDVFYPFFLKTIKDGKFVKFEY